MIFVTCSLPKVVYRADTNERSRRQIESMNAADDSYDVIREPSGDYVVLQPQQPPVTYNTLELPRPTGFGDYLDVRGSSQ